MAAPKGNQYAKGNSGGNRGTARDEREKQADIDKRWDGLMREADKILKSGKVPTSEKIKVIKIMMDKALSDKRGTMGLKVSWQEAASEEELDKALIELTNGKATAKTSTAKKGTSKKE